MHRHLHRVRPASAPGRAWRGWTALLLAGVTSVSGCYTNVPVSGAPRPGTKLVVNLTDRGRVAMGDSIGPSAEEILGEVQTSSDSSYVLRVESIRYLNGQSNRWTGESLTIRTDLIGRTRERRFSRTRTWALGLGTAAAVLALALTTDLFGAGSLGREGPSPGPGPVQ